MEKGSPDPDQVMQVERQLAARRQQGQDWAYLSGSEASAATREFFRGQGYQVRCNAAPGDPSGYRVLFVPTKAAAQWRE